MSSNLPDSPSFTEALETLAQHVVLLDSSDWQSLFALQQHCETLQQALHAIGDRPRALHLVSAMAAIAEQFIHDAVPDSAGAVSWLGEAVSALQSMGEDADLAHTPASPAWLALADADDAASGGADDPVLAEFISRSLLVLDELQDQTNQIQHGADMAGAVSEWRRQIHTIKGESGMLGLDDVHDLCTAIEEALNQSQPSAPGLFHALDWLRWRFAADIDDHLVPDLGVVLGELAQGSALEERSAETFNLTADASMLVEFISEAQEHLENAEVQLLEMDNDPANAEAINALFRSFHTIKGLAGFMELDPIQRLAHETETFLDICRERPCASHAVDLVFEAIDGMKHLTAALRKAVEEGSHQMAVDIPLDILQTRLRQAIDDPLMFSDGVPASEAAPNAESPRLGELLVEAGVVDEETITQALRRQSGSGDGSKPRLGETLVREGVVDARQVTAALRKQRAPAQATQVRDSVKVDAQRLDRLVDAIGELVIAESMVSQDEDVQRVAHSGSELSKRVNLLGKITRELQEIATSLRMTPIKSTFQRMARLARDVAGRTGKEVEFRTQGEDTELDKNVVDRIGDPLVHMVRNAIDHGLEPSPEQRRAAGKPGCGLVELKAYHQGGNICIQISDDGRGMDRARLTAKAVDKGIISAAEAVELSDGEVYKLIFHPGFSTADQVSDLSGRGVGMDVVKKSITELRGQVDIDSTPGKGSTFTIRLPLTLAIIDGMVCRIGEERYIIPTLAITRSLRPRREQVATAMGRGEMLSMQGEVIPIFRMHRLMNVQGAIQDPAEALLVIIDGEERKTALMVDELLGKQQIVIKSLGNGLRPVPGIAGGAIMSDGSVGLIADPMALVALAHGDMGESA